MNERIKPTSPEEIKVNEYGGGKSLCFIAPCGMKGTVGVMNPGETIDVSTNLPEKVKIVRGRLAVTVPGVSERRVYEKGQTAFIPGSLESVLFEALDGNQVAYECIYYQVELDPDIKVDTNEASIRAEEVLKG